MINVITAILAGGMAGFITTAVFYIFKEWWDTKNAEQSNDYKGMEAKEKKELTVQELCDKLTLICHSGYAHAVVRHVDGDMVRAVTDVEMVGDSIALLTSREKQ